MKRYRIIALIMLATLLLGIVLTACNNNQTNDNTQTGGNNQDAVYTLQYTDDAGTHTLSVKHGDLYSLKSVPVKNGYEFVGLYDSETGGTQYVNAQGSALAPFTDDKNMVLFPRWAANEYTFVLDYQGAAVTGDRQMSVSYGSKLTNLPVNLTMANKTFVGWFTQPDKQGVQIADQYGVIPGKDLVTERNFDLSDPDGYVYLYAGFQGEMYDVTFYFGAGIEPETVKVEYGTDISSVRTETRVDGKAVYKWSLKENDVDQSNIFNGKVTSGMMLYAAEFAPVIDFEGVEGGKINSIIAPAGTSIVLPVPVRENYVFTGWYTTEGEKAEYKLMPEDSVKLIAKWNPMIIFDERGGTEVSDIAQAQGTKIELPVPEKEGYVFAGWFTENDDVYINTEMPDKSIKLKAMWYKVKTAKIVVRTGDNEKYVEFDELTSGELPFIKGPEANFREVIDLSGYINASTGIKATLHFDIGIGAKEENATVWDAGFYLYDGFEVSDANYLDSVVIKDFTSRSYVSYSEAVDLPMDGNTLYICYYVKMKSRYYTGRVKYRMYFRDIWLDIEYPDTSKLY